MIKKIILYLLFLQLNVNIYSVSNFLIASIPKSGTHQIKKLIGLLIENTQRIPLVKEKDYFVRLYPDKLQQVNGPIYHAGHHLGIEENRKLALSYDLKIILNIRDPRNQVVSFARERRNQLPGLTINGVITLMIQNPGFYWENNSGWFHPVVATIKSLNDFYDLYLDWCSYPNVYMVKFENLVGPKGGGSIKRQLEEIKKIADFLKVDLDRNAITKISRQVWSGTATFSGQTSNWKNYFTEDHERLFKEVAGQLLINLGYEQDFNW